MRSKRWDSFGRRAPWILSGAALTLLGLALHAWSLRPTALGEEAAAWERLPRAGLELAYAVRLDLSTQSLAGSRDELSLGGTLFESTGTDADGQLLRRMSLAVDSLQGTRWQNGPEQKDALRQFLARPRWLTVAPAGDEPTLWTTRTDDEESGRDLLLLLARASLLRLPANAARGPWGREGTDFWGRYQARLVLTEGDLDQGGVRQEWLAYLQPGGIAPTEVVAPSLATYRFDQGAVHSLDWSTTTRWGESTTRVTLSLRRLHVRRQAEPLALGAAFQKARAHLVAGPATAPREPSSTEQGRDAAALLTEVDQITMETPSKEHYRIFRELKQRFQDHPEELTVLDRVDYTKPPRDAAHRRQLSLIYGALAQSGQPEAWPYLERALREGQDDFIGFQAVAAAGDFSQAPAEAFDVLSAVEQTHPVEDVRHAATLALGSLARHHEAMAERLRPRLLGGLRDARDPLELDVLLAAAGNHGDPAYWPGLQRLARHPDPRVRARALFAARALSGTAVTAWIIATAEADESPRVHLEGLKTLAERSHFASVCEGLTRIALRTTDDEVRRQAVRLLQNAAAREPEAARAGLRRLRERTRDPRLMSQIDGFQG